MEEMRNENWEAIIPPENAEQEMANIRKNLKKQNRKTILTSIVMVIALLVGTFYGVMPLAEKIYNGWQKQNGAYSALSNLYALLAKTVFSQEFYVSTREKQLLTPVLTYLEANLCDPELPIGQLNTLAGVSDVYLRRLFKKQFDAAPAAFVIRERMNLAKELLENEDLSITEVALQTGYRDPLYFSRLFKKQTGLTPSEYRKQHMDDLF